MADTTVQMTRAMADECKIRLVPLYIVMDGESHSEGDLDLDWFYRQLAKRKEKGDMPTTSAPSVGDFLKAYHELSTEAESVVDISLSSKFGATYSSALQAARIAAKETPDIPFVVVDTLTICVGQMFVAQEAARAAAEGKKLSEVIEATDRMVRKVNYLILSEDLSYLARAGRTHRASQWVGSKISNFVIMEVDASTAGEHKPLSRCRTRRQAMQRLIEIVRERSGPNKIHAAVVHSNAQAEAEELRSELLSQFHCVECHLRRAFPVVALSGGLGSLKLGWWHED